MALVQPSSCLPPSSPWVLLGLAPPMDCHRLGRVDRAASVEQDSGGPRQDPGKRQEAPHLAGAPRAMPPRVGRPSPLAALSGKEGRDCTGVPKLHRPLIPSRVDCHPTCHALKSRQWARGVTVSMR